MFLRFSCPIRRWNISENLSRTLELTLRLFFGRFILNDVPMLDKDSVLNADNICSNPIHRSTETAKSRVHDHEVSLSQDRSGFVQRWWDALVEIEQTLTARCDMSAVLNVVRGPVVLGRCVVTFSEESVKSLKNECLIFFCLVGFIEFFLLGKTMPFALYLIDPVGIE